jgi:hypothetical protein
MQEIEQKILLTTNNIIELCADLNKNVLNNECHNDRVDYCLAIVRNIAICALDLDDYLEQIIEE